eukprot:COSAG04_NODE_8221_length_1005_cov_1.332230_2_plen_239_part_01
MSLSLPLPIALGTLSEKPGLQYGYGFVPLPYSQTILVTLDKFLAPENAIFALFADRSGRIIRLTAGAQSGGRGAVRGAHTMATTTETTTVTTTTGSATTTETTTVTTAEEAVPPPSALAPSAEPAPDEDAEPAPDARAEPAPDARAEPAPRGDDDVESPSRLDRQIETMEREVEEALLKEKKEIEAKLSEVNWESDDEQRPSDIEEVDLLSRLREIELRIGGGSATPMVDNCAMCLELV